jgi:hypothetical protein
MTLEKRFSKEYNTYNEWLVDNTSNTDYINRVKRLHSLYPNANLSELRGHASEGKQEKALKTRQPVPVSHRAENNYSSLSPREKANYAKSLEVAKKMREGQSFTKATKEARITPKQALRSGIFYQHGRFWRAPKNDNYVRHLMINENGREVIVSVRGDRIASMIGSYHNAVKALLNTGDMSGLRPFQYAPFTDIKGQWHQFETRPSALKIIADRREDEEFYDIYV